MEHKFLSSKTARYFTHGNPQTANKVLYVLHGYGQLADYFLKSFTSLPADFFVVAPEGLHRFYLKGSNGRVGASWMTKEDRESDIKDTLMMLDRLEEIINSKYTFEKKIVLGFSQGGATAARWNAYSNKKARHVIYWASVFPPDLPAESCILPTATQQNYFLLGNEDVYFNAGLRKDTLEFYHQTGVITHEYTGNHSIDQPSLLAVLSEI
jgi:predicted esterase